jgi:hypothetical protein
VTPREEARARAEARLEDVAFMAACGESALGVSMRLGVRPAALDRFLLRWGRPDLAALLRSRVHHYESQRAS